MVYVVLFKIYRILCLATGKCYIGQSQFIDTRKSMHFSALNTGKHDNQKLLAAYREHGKAAFQFEIIEVDILRSDIDEREAYWIKFYNSYHEGYNKTDGGSHRNGQRRPWILNGVQYESIIQSARANNISKGTARKYGQAA